jgi:hypothetical protein
LGCLRRVPSEVSPRRWPSAAGSRSERRVSPVRKWLRVAVPRVVRVVWRGTSRQRSRMPS